MHYFVSDIHLGSGDAVEQRRVERDFLDFLTMIEADAESLFLVGDIFDFWFEYKEVVPKGFVRVLGRLAELSDKGVRVVMLTGNHDMWVGDYLTEAANLLACRQDTLCGAWRQYEYQPSTRFASNEYDVPLNEIA